MSTSSKLDEIIGRKLEEKFSARLDAAVERAMRRMFGEDEPASAPVRPTEPKPAKRRATTKPKPAKRAKASARPSAAPQTAPQRRGGPTPGSPADRIVKALTTGPMNAGEFAEVLAGIDASDEAKRQAVTRLSKSGRLVVTQEKTGNVYRLGTDDHPRTGE